jgi:hypothetical protein
MGFRYVQTMKEILMREDLKPTEKLVLLKIASHTDDNGGQSWPSYATLAIAASRSRRQVMRLVETLIQAEWLVKDLRGYHSNRYSINLSKVGTGKGGVVTPMTPPPPVLNTGGGDTHVTRVVTPMSPPVVTPMSPRSSHLSSNGSKPPLPPLKAGGQIPRVAREKERRVTRAERQFAEEQRARCWGGCPHEPRCRIYADCIDRLIRENRGART